MTTSPTPGPCRVTSGGRSTVTVWPASGPSVSLTWARPQLVGAGVAPDGGVDDEVDGSDADDPCWSQGSGAMEITWPCMKVTPWPAKLCDWGRPSPVGRSTHIPRAAAAAMVRTMALRVHRIHRGVAGRWRSARDWRTVG